MILVTAGSFLLLGSQARKNSHQFDILQTRSREYLVYLNISDAVGLSHIGTGHILFPYILSLKCKENI